MKPKNTLGLQQSDVHASSQKKNKAPGNKNRLVKSANGNQGSSDQDQFVYNSNIPSQTGQKEEVIQKIEPAEFYKELGLKGEIERSEEFSIDQNLLKSDSKEQLQNALTNIINPCRNAVLNIMVCGASETGKSCFVDAFLNSKCQSVETIRDKTTMITEKKGTRRTQGTTFQITMIDTPGYKQSGHQSYYLQVEEYILSKLETYQKKKQQKLKDRERMITGKRTEVPDERMHCCLYFLKGPRIQDRDCKLMKALESFVNVIPIIAKGDCYTLDEIKQIKRELLVKKQKYKLQWFECEEVIRAKDPQKLKQLLEGPFGQAPPFVVISGVANVFTDSQRIVKGRQYSWGICDISNPKHSDFQLLSCILINYLASPLIECTDLVSAVQALVKVKPKQEEKNNFKLALGGGILLGFGGFVLFKILQRRVG